MSTQRKSQYHTLLGCVADALVEGGEAFFAYCSCGWNSRACSTQGVAYGLWRRHTVTSGR